MIIYSNLKKSQPQKVFEKYKVKVKNKKITLHLLVKNSVPYLV